MGYQALYRTWRPQLFKEIIGQKAIIKTLKNSVIEQKISHAYLFFGPRGTGKTSVAKIFSKAVNCLNISNGEPCNKCNLCISITNGNQEDVIEIDAASNNGIEEIRLIRERAKYSPTESIYKIYILDEVHMLSANAFNALLKIMEEPPKNLIFILATTEPHKILSTICSRTQRFQFKLIDNLDIVKYLKYILKEKSLLYETEALEIIAKSAEGGLRDALNILDQVIIFGDSMIRVKDVLEVTGTLDHKIIENFLYSCYQKEIHGAFKILNEIFNSGKDPKIFLQHVLMYCRDMLIYKKSSQFLSKNYCHLNNIFKELVKNISYEKIYYWINILCDTQSKISLKSNVDIYLEVVILKLIHDDNYLNYQEKNNFILNLQEEMKIFKKEFSTLKQEMIEMKKDLQKTFKITSQEENKPIEKENNDFIFKKNIFTILKQAKKINLFNLQKIWDDFLISLSPTERAILRSSEPKAASNDGVIISFDYDIIFQRAIEKKELIKSIQKNLNNLIPGYLPEIIFISSSVWLKLRQEFLSKNKESKKLSTKQSFLLQNENDDGVSIKKAKELFGPLLKIQED